MSWKILNVGRFAGVEEKAIARLGNATVRAAYVAAGIKNPNGKTFNVGEVNRRVDVLEKIDPAIGPDVTAASARENGETLQGSIMANEQLEREHNAKPAPVKPAAEIAKEIISTGVMPAGFETWSKPKQIELVQAMIPIADARTAADLRSIESRISGKAQGSKLDILKAAHVAAFGQYATDCKLIGQSSSEAESLLERSFYFSNLTLPAGLVDNSALAEKYGKAPAVTFRERATIKERQTALDTFLSKTTTK